MGDITIYGYDRSNFVWAARLACHEKGVDCTLEPSPLADEAYLALHPFRKMPAVRHNDFVLYETAAILRYVDEAFDGPSLQPDGATQRARMEQWMSVHNSYLDTQIIRQYVVPYVNGGDDGPDREKIDAALKLIPGYLATMDEALADGPYLFGDSPTLADLLMFPTLFYLGKFPEGAELLKPMANVNRFLAAIQARPSFAATAPG